jgi:tetratricopeptide (TPR) repeat protein
MLAKMMKSRTLVTGDNTTNIQADTVNIILPEQYCLSTDADPIKQLDELLCLVSGLRQSSFLVEASQVLEDMYIRLAGDRLHKAPQYMVAALTEELALVKMDLGEISGSSLSAIPLFLRASSMWKKLGNFNSALFSFHMLGVCCGIAGNNLRALTVYKTCLSNIPKGKRYEKQFAHVSRDLGISLNRAGQFEQASFHLIQSKEITSHWHSNFNFGLDSQKLAISMAGVGKFDFSVDLLDQADAILSLKDDLSYVKNLNAKHFFSLKAGDITAANNLKREILEICKIRSFPHQASITEYQEKTGHTK